MASVSRSDQVELQKAPAGALVLFGSGPLLGAHIAAEFAKKGCRKIVLLSRDLSRLQEDASFVRQEAPHALVETVSVDLSNIGSVQKALREVDARLQGVPLEVVVYNPARTQPCKILELPVAEMEADYNISAASLYVVAQWACPQLTAVASKDGFRPALLITGGPGWNNPPTKYFSLAVSKGAQRTLAWALHKAFAPTGVHVSYISVGGKVHDGAILTNPKAVGVETWKEFAQPKGPSHWEFTMVDPTYLPYKTQEKAEWEAEVATCPRWGRELS